MELGGHAPAIVTEDADLALAAKVLSAAKFRNAGQVCVSPSRFIVHEAIYDRFESMLASAASAIVVGHGLDPEMVMGPLANERRRDAVEALVSDALSRGATLKAGGRRLGDDGFFFQPTVLGDVPTSARVMNEEPFAPVAALARYSTLADAIHEANRLAFGLAAYAYTTSSAVTRMLANELEAGMASVNGAALALPETPNGGVKDSGYGAEGGTEGIDPYLVTKLTAFA